MCNHLVQNFSDALWYVKVGLLSYSCQELIQTLLTCISSQFSRILCHSGEF